MQRYSSASSNAGNSHGGSVRDNSRTDPSFQSPNYPVNSRRQSQIPPYKLKCEKEPLNSRLGPPDFYPQTFNCPEETLTKEYLQAGYKETVEGIEEAREIALNQIVNFLKPEVIGRCKEAIRKRFRAINESRAQKRKAGQVYGVPLSGHLLVRSGAFPEQKPSGEDFRRRWIEALSQPHKRLRSLSEHVPHGFRRKSLFDIITRHNVPLVRATWFVKVTYLNQVRPNNANIPNGAPEKSQFVRTDQWTKDVADYFEQLLEEFSSKDGAITSNRDQPSPGLNSVHSSSSKVKTESSPSISDAEEQPSFNFKWWYMVRLVQWHRAEGLLLPSILIDRILHQLQEKDSLEILELLLPLLLGLLDHISLSQTYTRSFVEISVRYLNNVLPNGSSSVDGLRRASLTSTLSEMLRYLILSVPDTFVSLDCFPLPAPVAPEVQQHRGEFLKNMVESSEAVQFETQDAYFRYLSCGHSVASIEKRASDLAKIVNPNLQGRGAAKVVQALDKALVSGNLTLAYTSLFEDLSDSLMEERWISEVSPCLQSSLIWIGTVELSLICSVFFLCEWATCDYRDCRTAMPSNLKFTGRKDLSQIHMAVLLLKNKMEEMCKVSIPKNSSRHGVSSKIPSPHDLIIPNQAKNLREKKNKTNMLESPGPLHDIIVCWLDQHEVTNPEGFKRVDALITELICTGLFYPQAYVRQLIVSGLMDREGTPLDTERKKRHYRILKHLPASCLLDVIEESRVVETSNLNDTIAVYSSERHLVVRELSRGQSDDVSKKIKNSSGFSTPKQHNRRPGSRDGSSKVKVVLTELKSSISNLLHFPNISLSTTTEPKNDGLKGSIKRPLSASDLIKPDSGDSKQACEECRRANKRQKIDNRNNPSFQTISSNQPEDEDIWWVRKGAAATKAPRESSSSFKVEPSQQKTPKQNSRGRRKTQSLAQLAAARIESSQGASTSHVCDNKVSCPHHKSTTDGDGAKEFDRSRPVNISDIGKALKRLRMIEKRSVSIWVLRSVKQLVEGNEAALSKPGSFEERAFRWRLSEDELLLIMYILDLCCDVVPLVKFLIWLLSKIRARMAANIQGGRHAVQSKNRENQICQVDEAFIYSALQRYENVLLATDLLPEVLTAVMHRNSGVIMPNGKHPCSAAMAYTRYLLKKYREVASVARWEKSFRPTCDQKLLTELDNGRSIDGDSISAASGVSSGEDIDDHIRQKLSGRSSRNVPNMKDIVHRSVDEASRYFYGKEKKVYTTPPSTTPKGTLLEKWEDSFQIAHDIVFSLGDCIRQNCSALPEGSGDPSVVAAAVAAIVGNVGQAIAKLPDFTSTNNHQNSPSAATSMNCVRHILNIHITSLFLLKETLGDRLSRVFEVALAVEASQAISIAFAPTKPHRNQFQLSPESDMYGSHANDIHSNSTKGFVSRPTKIAAAISALIVGAVVHGVISLDRLITVFRLKEGLDIMQFVRNARSSNANGVSRSSSSGAFKSSDGSIEVFLHWFRLLIGNSQTVCDGLVCEILGEQYILALLRMQRMLPLALILPPAYSIFAMVIWRPYITNNGPTREDIQIYPYLSNAVGDAIKHQPFRDVCFRNTHGFYEILAADSGDSDFAAVLELHGSDKHLRATAFIPLRARLFLNALIECKMPASAVLQEDGSWGFDSNVSTENEMKLHERLLHILDTLQPAKFHWQWVELRLLLHEQALIEKIETQSMSFVEALRSLTPNTDSESEKKFTEIIISRMLVRPDAASLYSEVVHLLGKLLQESLVMDTKWILQGPDVLQGRKSIRQQLLYVAHRKGLSLNAQFWKPWGWSCSVPHTPASTSSINTVSGRGSKKKIEIMPIEEGEVIDELADVKKHGKSSSGSNNNREIEGPDSITHRVTEKALTELMLPCIDRSSSELRSAFAAELIKQMGAIETQINTITHNNNNSGAKQQGNIGSPGIEGTAAAASGGKSGRKGMRGGSPVIGRRPPVAAATDPTPPPVATLRSALWVRLQFLIRLLPVIYADRDPSGRNMRQILAGIILRLLGARVVYEEADLPTPTKRESFVSSSEVPLYYSVGSLSDRPGEGLFDRLLCVLHALLGSCKPSWLKPKLLPPSKSTVKPPRDFPAFDREAAENLQAALDKMELPVTIRRRIQSAMPYLPPTRPFSVPCLPPLSVPPLPFLLPGNTTTTTTPTHHQKNSNSSSSPNWTPPNLPSNRGKSQLLPSSSQEQSEMEIDPWTLLEDGTAGSSTSSSGGGGGGGGGGGSGSGMIPPGGDHSNLKASSWLKGAVRVRRTDLTYIGSLDDDS